MSSGQKPFNAAFKPADRYTAPGASGDCSVMVEGTLCAGSVLGTNGARTQVRFEMGGHTYVRWFDTDQVLRD